MARGPLKKLTAGYRNRLLQIYQDTCIEISRRVIERTPVDTGLLRKSWVASSDGSARVTTRQTNRGRAGSYVAVARALTLQKRYTFTNGQPYARRIEYNGHSPQAPRGMVRVTLAEYNGIVESQVRRHAA